MDQVTVKLRNPEEMAMIEKWYKNTPIDFFPVIKGGRQYIRKIPPKGHRMESWRRIHSHSLWLFMNTGNRYPGDPNVPTTWQEWQALEESITPSTMRDEIRLTRILIQYCDTKNEKVLDELKAWFADMNEVQRACMAKSVFDRLRDCSGTDLYFPFRDVYRVVHKYDIAAKPEYETKFWEGLKLPE